MQIWCISLYWLSKFAVFFFLNLLMMMFFLAGLGDVCKLLHGSCQAPAAHLHCWSMSATPHRGSPNGHPLCADNLQCKPLLTVAQKDARSSQVLSFNLLLCSLLLSYKASCNPLTVMGVSKTTRDRWKSTKQKLYCTDLCKVLRWHHKAWNKFTILHMQNNTAYHTHRYRVMSCAYA